MNRKEQIKELWRICFQDTEDFISLYFDRVFKEEEALFIELDGRIVSFLQIIPYTLTWHGREITMGYISGSCTDPRERGKGLMRKLLMQAFDEMHNKGYDITGLIPAEPWLFDYYRAHGYTEVFDYSREEYLWDGNRTAHEAVTPLTNATKDLAKWYNYLDRKLKERTCCVLHSQEDFQTSLADYELGEGLVVGLENEYAEPVGLAFAVAGDQEVRVKEILCDNDAVKTSLLRHICHTFGMQKAIIQATPLLSDSQSYGMAMILNRAKMIREWLDTHPNSPHSIEELHQMDNESLTTLLMGYAEREAVMSLMMD
ncbi:GNAT family N-acetyltransferase [Parabacteroides sp. OttesenSCG-928-G06]|nr:GNAT family N-acetyltransferase [Parabacteroides sp. OttesenSCG-928-G06]